MRPIIFRGKRVDTGEWVEGFYRKTSFYNKLGDKPIFIYEKHFIGKFDNIECFDGIFEQVEVIPETVGQYIGKFNSVSIFEGDIDKSGYSIKWNKEKCLFALHNQKGWIMGYPMMIDELTIIGNIHDNKSLING